MRSVLSTSVSKWWAVTERPNSTLDAVHFVAFTTDYRWAEHIAERNSETRRVVAVPGFVASADVLNEDGTPAT